MCIWIYETLEMIEKIAEIGEYTYKITLAKNVSLLLNGKLK